MVLVFRDTISKRHSLPADDKTGQEQIPGSAWSSSGLRLSPRPMVAGPVGLYIQQQSSQSLINGLFILSHSQVPASSSILVE